MSRKTKEETETTRQHILDTALELFRKQGYVRTTLEQIAQRAGYTRGAIYWHYKNKQELLMMLAEEVEGEVESEINDIFCSEPKSLEELIHMAHRYLLLFENHQRYRNLHEILYLRTEWTEELALFREKDHEELQYLLKFLTKTFQDLQRCGKIRKNTIPEDAARELCVFLTGTITLWLWYPNLFSLKNDIPRMLYNTLKGYELSENPEK